MKKINSLNELQVGHVYNFVYVGDNEAYARINGKETVRIVATKPALRFVPLHYQFADWPYKNDDLLGSEVTSENPAAFFKEKEIYEPDNEGEWFKHSLKVGSLTEGVEQGILTAEIIRECDVNANRSPFHTSAKGGTEFRVYIGINVEDKTKFPMLQRVFVLWKSWEEMKADFQQFGVTYRR